jgi:uncharacterized protein with GYD domain
MLASRPPRIRRAGSTAAKKLLADMGGEMKQFYMVMGDFDFVGICEAPDDAVMAGSVP